MVLIVVDYALTTNQERVLMIASNRAQALQSRHAEEDEKLHREMSRPRPNDVTIARIKKRKLSLKDSLK